VVGNHNDEYILAFDPSWSESESSDDFAILLLKLNKDLKKGTVVHSYAMSGANLKTHIRYMAYLMTHFNIVAVVGDYNGGVQFMNSCNESTIFKNLNLRLETIEADLDKVADYEKNLRRVKNQYNKSSRRYVFLRKPSSQWIRAANESLQSAFDHKKIFFAGAAMNDDYNIQRKSRVPIKNLKFIRNDPNTSGAAGARMIDLVEHQKDMMDLIKVQCALIQVTTSVQGTQSFDLPPNLRKQKGADKARKDSYSALVLANWMMNVFYDMEAFEGNYGQQTFTPMFIS
jgi:hypothetical protein